MSGSDDWKRKITVISRYLMLLAHLVYTISVYVLLDTRVMAEDIVLDQGVFICLLLGISAIAFELALFVYGLKALRLYTCLISILGHSLGIFALSYFVFRLACELFFWWLFFVCNVLPLLMQTHDSATDIVAELILLKQIRSKIPPKTVPGEQIKCPHNALTPEWV